MNEKIKKTILKRSNQIIALIVLAVTTIGVIAVSKVKLKTSNILGGETARAMTYDVVEEGDEETETPYVEFNSYFLRDINRDGIAEKIKGTCKEIDQTDTLYMDINVLTNGYLENGKIEIQGENFTLQTSITKDEVVAENYISDDTKSINLNKISNGTQKTLTGNIKANIGKNINNYSSGNNKVILTGTHVADDGTTTEIRKEIVLSTDWYGNVENDMLITENNIIYSLDNALDETSQKINLEFVVETYETKNQLMLKSNTIEGTIPELNGYKPLKVNITGKNVEYTYDETTRKFTATRNAVLGTSTEQNATGEVSEEAYSTKYYTDSNAYKKNTFNIKIVYPYDALKENDVLLLTMPVSSVYEAFNNQNEEFANPIKSNTAQYLYTFMWRNESFTVNTKTGTYRSTDQKYIVSKKEVLRLYNDEAVGNVEDNYEIRWYLATQKDQQSIKLIGKHDYFGEKIGTMRYKYAKSSYTGIYFEGATNLINENGYINLYNNETDELIHSFTKEELAQYTNTNPYMYEKTSEIRLETSETNISAVCIHNIRQFDNEEIVNSFTKDQFKKIIGILSKLEAYITTEISAEESRTEYSPINTLVEYVEPTSKTELSISKEELSTQKTEENVEIKINTVEDLDIEKWQNGVFLVKLPTEIIDAKVNNINISNDKVNLAGYEVLEKDGSKFIKIMTQNDEPQTYTITIDTNITVDPEAEKTTSKIELYAYNQETNNYAETSADKYDINNNGETSDIVNYVTKEIKIIVSSSLLTNEKISGYNTAGDFVVSPQTAEIEINEAKSATVEVNVTNNFTEAISDILLIGTIPFKGNKYQTNNLDLGSTITTTLTGPITFPTELNDKAVIYYSENETVTTDVKNTSNNYKTEAQVTDWSKIKTYLIDLKDYELEAGKECKFTYQIKLPTTLEYNDVAYSTHAVYFAEKESNKKLYTQVEAEKVGIRIARKFDVNITNTKLAKDVPIQGATFSLVEEGSQGEKVVVTDTEGKAQIQNIYANRTYILKQTIPSIGYVANNAEVKFRTYIEKNELKYEIISGQAKTSSIAQATDSTKAHIDFSFENMPKYTVILNQKDSEGNILKGAKINIKGNNTEQNIYTNKNGAGIIQDLEAGVEYTIETTASGCYALEPIKFKLDNNNGELSFTTISGSFSDSAQIIESTETSGTQAEDRVVVSLVSEKIPIYNLQLTKYAKGQETTLSGAKFKIEGEGITEGGKYLTTSDNGVLTIEGLYQYVEGKDITGEYTITEVTPPEGYALQEQPLKVKYSNEKLQVLNGTIKGDSVVENGTAKIAVENEPLFTLTKVNEITKEPIQGVKFAIYEVDEYRNAIDFAKDINGNYVGTEETINRTNYRVLTTNENGIISAGLKTGLYKAVEIQAPHNFNFDEDEENRTSYFGIGKNVPATKGIKQVWENIQKECVYYLAVTKVDDGIIAVGGGGRVVKYDLEGNVVWKSTEKPYSYYGVTTIDDGIVAVGWSGEVVKYDFNGNVIWEKIEESYCYKDVAKVSDGVIAVGNQGKITKYGFSGETIWKKEEPKYTYRAVTAVDDGVITVADGGIVIKYDLAGNVVWKNTEKSHSYSNVVTVSDGIIAVNGLSLDTIGEVVKYDFNGNVVWENAEKKYQFQGLTAVEDGVVATGVKGKVIKYDLLGNIVWENTEKTYDYEEIIAVEDGLIAVCYNGQVVKFGLDGNIIWENTENSYSYSDVTTVENGMIAIGSDSDRYNIGRVIKYDLEGNILWENSEKAYLYNGITTVNNGVIVVGNDPNDDSSKVLKYNLDGNIVWEKSGKSLVYKDVTTVEDGVIVVGSSGAVIKYDLDGNILWENNEKGTTASVATYYYYYGVATVADGVIAVSNKGRVVKYDSNGKIVWENKDKSYIYQDVLVVDDGVIAISYNGQVVKYGFNGNLIWEKTSKSYLYNGATVVEDGIIAVGRKYYSAENTLRHILVKYDFNGNMVYQNVKDVYEFSAVIKVENGFIGVSDDGEVARYTEIEDSPELAQTQKIEVQNNTKVLNIKTRVQRHQKGNDIIKGGTITGEGEQYLEQVEYGKDSTKEIKAVPDTGYKVENITVNGEKIPFKLNDDGSVTLDKFTQVTENKNIEVKFSNTIGQVKVNHYAKDLRPEASEDLINVGYEIITGEIGETYKTEPLTNLNYYELLKDENGAYILPENAMGTYTSEIQEVNYYYESKYVTLTVHHYLEGTEYKLADDEQKRLPIHSAYTTERSSKIQNELVSEPENKQGTIEKDIEVTYYYRGVIGVDAEALFLGIDGTAFIQNSTDPVEYNISYSVTDEYQGDIIAKIVCELPAEIDVSKSDLAGGEYNSTDKTITWTDYVEDINTSEDKTGMNKKITVVYKNLGNKCKRIISHITGEVYLESYKAWSGSLEYGEIHRFHTIVNGYADIFATKEWKDDDNANGKRPESIKIQIKKDDTILGEAIVSEADGWKHTFTDILRYDENGELIDYKIDETEINEKDLEFYQKSFKYERASTILDFTPIMQVNIGLINTYAIPEEKTSVTVTKIWNDNNNANGKRPESIKLQVKNGSTVVKEQVVTANEEWKYTFTDLPVYDEQGNAINYTVDEAEVNAGELKLYTKSINGTTITNTFEVPDEKTSVTVTKTWNDNNNEKGKRPESIKLQVKNGSTVVKEQVVTANEGWKYTFTNLPVYDEQGNKINYTVDETEVNTGELKLYTKSINGTTITNTFAIPDQKISITVNKKWEDNNDVNGKRPESIKLQIKSGSTVVKEQVVTANDNWKYTFTDLPMYDSQGNEIYYQEDEAEVNTGDLEYYEKVTEFTIIDDTESSTAIQRTITNKLNKITSVTAIKVWNDNNNENGKRPESIKLQVKNGSTVVKEQVVTANDNWKYTFTELPMYDDQSNKIAYTVDEAEVNEGDLKLYSKTIKGTTISNTYVTSQDKVSVTVSKKWDDNNNAIGKRPESIKLQVKSGNTIVKEQVVTEKENWKYTFIDLPMYDLKGNKISYTVDEAEVNKDDLAYYQIANDMSSSITENENAIEREIVNKIVQNIKITVVKEWNDNNNANGKRPESIKLQIKNGNTVVKEQVVTENDNWKYTFTELPVCDQQGNVINYTLDEAEVNTDDLKFYTKSINGNKVTNTFVSSDEKTSITVTKTWNDNNNANGKRPESIKLQIKNGNTIVKEQVVTANNNWKYTFTNLAKYDSQGNTINYTVDEAEVNTDDLKFYTKTVNGTTITNTFNVPDEKTSVTATKVWNDKNNENSKRPESIKLQVKNESTVIAEQVVTASDNWKYTFTNLAKYDSQGKTINYTVDEAEVNTDDLKFYTKSINGTTITNTYVPIKLCSIQVAIQPDKLTYKNGQNFNPTGMIVTATYSNDETKEITGYTITNGDNLKVGQKSVEISYTEEGVTQITTQAINVNTQLEIEFNKYYERIDDGKTYLCNISPITALEEMKQNITTNGTIKVYSNDDEITDNDDIITTSMKLVISLNDEKQEFIIAVKGDTNGDGISDLDDILEINKHRLNKALLTNERLLAGDVDKNNKADLDDILQINKYRLGKINTL